MSRITNTVISLDTSPTDIDRLSNYSITNGIGDPAALKDGNTYYRNVATGEPGLVRLDGSYSYYTEYKDFYRSTALSDNEGVFSQPIKFTAEILSGAFTSNGLTLYFGDSPAKKFTITWYVAGSQPVSMEIEENRDAVFLLSKRVENFNKIEIIFTETVDPYRYLKITEIKLGQVLVLGNSDIIEAKLTEEFDPLCDTVSASALEYTILDEQQRYNLLNPDNMYQYLQSGQDAYCEVTIEEDGQRESHKIGPFYLTTWESTTGPTATMYCENIIGLLEQQLQNTSLYFQSSGNAGILFEDLFVRAGISDYWIDDEIANIKLQGFIPPGTVRSALQHLCIATMSTVRVERNGYVRVYRPQFQDPNKKIEQVYGDGKAEITDLQKDGISVQWYQFEKESGITAEIYAGEKTASTEWVTVDLDYDQSPWAYTTDSSSDVNFLITSVKYLNKSGAQQTMNVRNLDSDIGRAHFEAQFPSGGATDSRFNLTGDNIKPVENTVVYGQSNDNVVSGNYLITSETQAQQIAKYWYDYINQRNLSYEFKAIHNLDVNIGDMITTPVTESRNFDCMVTFQEIDLAGGLLANVTGIGKTPGQEGRKVVD